MLVRMAIGLTLVSGVICALTAEEAKAQSYNEVDVAIDYSGLPPVFYWIAWRESGDDPLAVNPKSGACGPFQMLPSVAAEYGYSCYDLQDPDVAAAAAYELYLDYGLSPWALTAY